MERTGVAPFRKKIGSGWGNGQKLTNSDIQEGFWEQNNFWPKMGLRIKNTVFPQFILHLSWCKSWARHCDWNRMPCQEGALRCAKVSSEICKVCRFDLTQLTQRFLHRSKSLSMNFYNYVRWTKLLVYGVFFLLFSLPQWFKPLLQFLMLSYKIFSAFIRCLFTPRTRF